MKYIFYILTLMSVNSMGSAQTIDTVAMSRIVERSNKPILTAIEAQTKILKDHLVIAKTNPVTKESKTIENIITFLPVVFFILIVTAVFIKLKKDNVKLSNILIDKETLLDRKKADASIAESKAKIVAAKADAIKANPGAFENANLAFDETSTPTTGDDTENKKEQSTSRLIAFICGIISIALACCITSFYFYKSFTGTGDVSIGNLANVLYGLGLGVLPYGFNKIAAALK